MSEAYQCDRCDTFVTGSPDEPARNDGTLRWKNEPMQFEGLGDADLCPSCVGEYKEWMHSA